MTVEIPATQGLETKVSSSAKIMKELFLTCNGTGDKLVIDDNAVVGAGGRPKFEFLGNNNTLKIGKKCQVKRGHYRFVGDNMSIEIGDFTTINGAYILCMEGASVRMGYDCMLSYDIEIRTSDAHSILDSATGKRINHAKDVILGDHVWVGKEVLLMPGSSIASNSIVGTRAIVTSKFEEENVAIGGVPGRVISQGRTWARPLLP